MACRLGKSAPDRWYDMGKGQSDEHDKRDEEVGKHSGDNEMTKVMIKQ